MFGIFQLVAVLEAFGKAGIVPCLIRSVIALLMGLRRTSPPPADDSQPLSPQVVGAAG